MNCQECGAPLVNGVCPNAEAHNADAVRFAEGLATAMSRTLEPVLTRVAETQTALLERLSRPAGGAGDGDGEEDEQTRAERAAARGAVNPTDAMSDVYDQLWNGPGRSADENFRTRRANLELARMIMGGTAKLSRQPFDLKPSERFLAAYNHHVFEMPARDATRFGSRIMVEEGRYDDGSPKLRAMDTAESGNGQQLVGAQYETELWAAARAMDPLLSLIREIPMRFPTDTIPVDGALPELRFLAESTADSATAYTASDTPSNKATLTAKKFGINQLWSGELDEDSIIRYVEFLRAQLNRAAAHGLASSLYNGDTTNAATGNINLDDADPADTKHYLAYDGIRKYWLVTATAQGKDMAGTFNPIEIDRARGKLNGTTDDVDADFNNINWGANVDDLALVADFDSYMNLLDMDKVATVDKYGPQATVITGELGRYRGIRVFSPAYASKTDTDGKANDTESQNVKGQISVFNRNGWIRGSLRGLQLYFDRVQRTDQFLFEMYMRKAFTRFGGNVAAGIYDITV